MRRVSKLLVAMILSGTATSVAAQSFNQELGRYRAAKLQCEEAFQLRLEQPRNGCMGQCRVHAEATRDRCLATAERRYGEALRRALRIRR